MNFNAFCQRLRLQMKFAAKCSAPINKFVNGRGRKGLLRSARFQFD